MSLNKERSFNPDYAIHPGIILCEIVEANNIKKKDLALRCGLEEKTMSQILNGKAPIEPNTAISLERVLGISAETWNNLNANYELFFKRVESNKKLQENILWAKEFPYKEICKRGFFERPQSDVDLVDKLFRFLGVCSVEAWENQFAQQKEAYRHSPAFKIEPKAIASWLRMGELEANEMSTNKYDKGRFHTALDAIRKHTIEPPKIFENVMVSECAQAGIALVFVEELSSTHISGATRWLNSNKAMIVLSLRHKWEDHFWFSFFHEAAHILLHSKKITFIDSDKRGNSELEESANNFAADILIPKAEYRRFVQKELFNKDSIQVFSREIGICPGVVVGRLQRDRHIDWSWFNDLRRKFTIVKNYSK